MGGLGLAWIVVYVGLVPSLRSLPAPVAAETLPRPGSEASGTTGSADVAGAD